MHKATSCVIHTNIHRNPFPRSKDFQFLQTAITYKSQVPIWFTHWHQRPSCHCVLKNNKNVVENRVLIEIPKEFKNNVRISKYKLLSTVKRLLH